MLTVTKFRAPRAAGSSTAIAATSAPAAPAAAFAAGPSSVDLNDWSSTCSATEHVSAYSCSRDSPYGLQLRAMTHRLGIQGLVDQRFLVLRQRLVQVLVVLVVRPVLRQRRARRRQVSGATAAEAQGNGSGSLTVPSEEYPSSDGSGVQARWLPLGESRGGTTVVPTIALRCSPVGVGPGTPLPWGSLAAAVVQGAHASVRR